MSDRSPAHPQRWWALAVLCAAQFIVILDTSIVGVALPALQRSLGFDAAGLQWIFNAYVVAFGGLLLLGGRLSDLFGARRVFAIGFGVLTVASLAAGLADSPAVLLASRALQGAGAALIAPASLSLVMALFAARPAELGRALGLWGAAAAAGGTAGVFLGGVVTEWLSWRWTFLVNVPFGLLVLAATFAFLPRGTRTKGAIDLAGAALATAGTGLIVYGIVALGGSPLAIQAVVAGLVLLVVFVLVERRRANPLVPLAIFRAPDLAVGNVVTALLGAAWIPMWFFLNMYLQQALGLGAFESGLALLPMTITIMVFMIGFTGRVVARSGPKLALVVGLAALGFALLLMARLPVGGSFAGHVLAPSLLAALGMAIAYVPSVIVSTAGARPEQGGLASGLVNTSYQIGSAIGLAAMVAIASHVTGAAPTAAAAVDGFSAAFYGAAAIAFLAAIIAAIAVRRVRPAQVAHDETTPSRGASAMSSNVASSAQPAHIVVKNGYFPSRLEVPAGKPVTLELTREDRSGCTREIVFPTLGITRLLPTGANVRIEIPASPEGVIPFHCGMDMVRGEIVVGAAQAPAERGAERSCCGA